ncbi:hypothetical protein N0V90_003802 [Kalmusia sp. IMI 367209]|nr:hypothetical protein N0V90_003802 [Kalmusia sp. IMI 367209]
MPYNNTPIAPSKEVSGQVSLPLARVQKIINADPERLHTSKNAAFAIALATELFIQHLATATHNVVKTETKKPRRNVQYRDVASAVAKTDNLEFLVDVVPKTVLYKDYKKARKEKEAGEGGAKEGEQVREGNGDGELKEGASALERLMANGRKTITEEKEKKEPEKEANAATESVVEAMEVDKEVEETKETPAEQIEDSEAEEDGAAMQIEMEMRGPRRNGGSPQIPRRSGGFTAINGSK